MPVEKPSMTSLIFEKIPAMSEVVVADYFRRQGFTVERLDEDQSAAPTESCEWLVTSTLGRLPGV
jgi:hypothetical protein